MDNNEYVKAQGAICPFCKSDAVVADLSTLDIDGISAWITVTCQSCDKEYLDLYELKGYEEIDE